MAESIFGKTDTGKQREKNEDTFIAHSTKSGDFIIAAVIDGVGGYAGGEVAAELTRNVIRSHVDQLPGNVIDIMKQALSAANDEIFAEKKLNTENEQMACVVTMAIADVENNKFYYAHVGDTRLYLFRDKSLVKITRDHSMVGFLEETGRLSEDAAMKHPKRNEINKALGFEQGVLARADFVDTGESPFLPGDILLLCSDGLSDMIGSDEITAILAANTELSKKASKLIDAANKAGGKDNITVVLMRNNKPLSRHLATKPATAVANTNTLETEASSTKKKQTTPENEVPEKRNNNNKGLVGFLVFLCVALACALVWSLLQDRAVDPDNNKDKLVLVSSKNLAEKQFADSINSAPGKYYSFTDSLRSVVISDTIFIDKDSMHIIGNGLILRSDSAYKGPVFVMGTNCSFLSLENISFQNFDHGIIIRNDGLELKHVEFSNCRIPFSYIYNVPADSSFSGRFSGTRFYFQDSLIQH